MVRGVTDIIGTLSQLLPPWALALLAVAVVIVGGPRWIDSVRNKQIRGRIRRMVRAEPELRARLKAEVLAMAGSKPFRLEGAAEQALKYDQRDLFFDVLARLEEGGAAADAQRIRARIAPERKLAGHPLEDAAAIERLLELDLREAAQARLDDALRRFPGNRDLEALGVRVREAPDLPEPDRPPP